MLQRNGIWSLIIPIAAVANDVNLVRVDKILLPGYNRLEFQLNRHFFLDYDKRNMDIGTWSLHNV